MLWAQWISLHNIQIEQIIFHFEYQVGCCLSNENQRKRRVYATFTRTTFASGFYFVKDMGLTYDRSLGLLLGWRHSYRVGSRFQVWNSTWVKYCLCSFWCRSMSHKIWERGMLSKCFTIYIYIYKSIHRGGERARWQCFLPKGSLVSPSWWMMYFGRSSEIVDPTLAWSSKDSNSWKNSSGSNSYWNSEEKLHTCNFLSLERDYRGI